MGAPAPRLDFFTRFLAGLALIAQLAPALLAAAAGAPIRIRAIQAKIGSTYRISGAGAPVAPGDEPDDLVVQVA